MNSGELPLKTRRKVSLAPEAAGPGSAAEAAAKALSLGQVLDALKGPGRGSDPAGSGQLVTALRGLYRTPWEMALQRWLDTVAPGDRSYLRPSRRRAKQSNVVLPGRRREV